MYKKTCCFLVYSLSHMTADTQFFTISTVQRDFICVDLSDFEKRRHEVVKTLMEAATTQGFFYGT